MSPEYGRFFIRARKPQSKRIYSRQILVIMLFQFGSPLFQQFLEPAFRERVDMIEQLGQRVREGAVVG